MAVEQLIRNRYYRGTGTPPTHTSLHHQADFDQFHLPLARLQAAHLHVWGIAHGLEVSATAGQAVVTVQPGVAIDSSGNLIALAASGRAHLGPSLPGGQNISAPFQLATTEFPDQSVYVTIQFLEIEQTGGGPAGRLEVAPWLQLQPTTDVVSGEPRELPEVAQGHMLVLAIVTLDAAGNVVAVAAEESGVPYRRRLTSQALGAVSLYRATREGETITDVLAGRVEAGTTGGLRITVPTAGDSLDIHADSLFVREATNQQPSLALETSTATLMLGTVGNAGTLSIQDSAGAQSVRMIGETGTLTLNAVSATGNVTVGESLSVNGRDVSAIGTGLDQHIARSDNPHGTTAAQVGALRVTGGTLSGNLWVNGTATINRDAAHVGVWSEVSGAGPKWAGFLRASSVGNDETQGVRAIAGGDGNGSKFGVIGIAEGTGTGSKVGVSGNANGGGFKQAGTFVASSAGNDETQGVRAAAGGGGNGNKFGVIGIAEGGANADWKIGVWGRVIGGARNPYAGFFDGNVRVTGSLSKGAGSFEIDHVEDPENKILRHNFVESPENLCLYRGKLKLNADGKGTVQMPSYFASLTKEDEATVYLTAVGEQAFPTSYKWDETYTAFTIFGIPKAEVTYLVLADRDDPVIHLLARPVEEEKGEGEKGKLLYPAAYGYSEEMRVAIQVGPFTPARSSLAPTLAEGLGPGSAPSAPSAPEMPQIVKPEDLDP